MKTAQFQSLIQIITGRDFVINTTDENIVNGKEYMVSRLLPITKRNINFKWKASLTDEKMLRSFITAFTSKYREPNPESYNYEYGGRNYTWAEKTLEQKEYCYNHHASHMYSKEQLLKQVENNFNNSEIESALIKYGFYPTEYGTGIFCFFETDYVINAINKMKAFLKEASIPYSNEYSDARWVYRFKLNLTKDAHIQMLNSFSNQQ